MTKVCHLSPNHSVFDDRIFYKEAISLSKAGYKVIVISGVENLRKVEYGVDLWGVALPNYLKNYLKIWKGRGILMKLRFLWYAWKANAVIYHVHRPSLLPIVCLIKIAQRLLRKRHVFIVHEIRDFYLWEAWLDRLPIGWYRKLRLWCAEKMDRFFHRVFVDYVIGVEESKVERPKLYGMPLDKILVIENYVRLDLFPFVPKTFTPNSFTVAYVGGLSRLRGIDVLAKACVLFGKETGIRPTLLLAGKAYSQEDVTWTLNFCRENARYVNLKFLGWISHTNVSRVLSEADVCCACFYSNRYQRVWSGKAGPIKIYEYMSCGKPIIVTDAPALQFIVQKARCGVVVSSQGGARAIADALKYLYDHPSLLMEMGRNGRRAVEMWWNWSIGEEKLLRVYTQLVSCSSK
ncbi:MAG: glycosyltransferase family 4 protein [Dehalococcoidia bacterium]|nr:glycosyltransferase family 4 protein [Dehalococcoidia bacterium]